MLNDDVNIVLDFISLEEEQYLLNHIQISKKRTGKGRTSIQRYGAITYDNYKVSKVVPQWLQDISYKIVDKDFLKVIPNHVTVNFYDIGTGILPHIDNKESGEIITVLSLLSDTHMILSKDNKTETIFLPRRSLLQLKNEYRWKWKHSIDKVKEPRYSLVFRNNNER